MTELIILQGTKINWKDPSKALTKLHPYGKPDSEDELPTDHGSFFNFFEQGPDPFDVSFEITTIISDKMD